MLANEFGFTFNEDGMDRVVAAAFLEVEDVMRALEGAGVEATDENVRAFAEWVSDAFTDLVYEGMPDLMVGYARSWDCEQREDVGVAAARDADTPLADLEQAARTAAGGAGKDPAPAPARAAEL